MADDFSGMTADEARARLVRDGANLLPEVKNRLNTIASGMPDLQAARPPMAAAGFGDRSRVGPMLVEDFLANSPTEVETVLCKFPKRLEVALQGNERILFDMGVRPVPTFLLEPEMHSYLKANRVERTDRAASPRPQARHEGFPEDHAYEAGEMQRTIVDLTMKLSRAEARIAELEEQITKPATPAKPATAAPAAAAAPPAAAASPAPVAPATAAPAAVKKP